MSSARNPGARPWIAAALAVTAAVGIAAVVEPGEAEVTRSDAAKAGAEALRAVGAGEVASVERSSSGDGAAWSVEVIRGSQMVEVSLDEGFSPVRLTGEPLDGRDANADLAAIADQFEYRRGVRDELREDRELPRAKRQRAAVAARRAVGGGRVVYVERSEDPSEAYEVDVRKGSKDIEVFLNRNFEVLRRQGFR